VRAGHVDYNYTKCLISIVILVDHTIIFFSA